MRLGLQRIAVLVAFLVVVAGVAPAGAQGGPGRLPPKAGVAPYDRSINPIDRMARRNLERRHLERRMRMRPPAHDPAPARRYHPAPMPRR